MKNNEWLNYVNVNGDFEFPKYLYKTISELMKSTLDLGTLVCSDQVKLRAYKERVKFSYKQKWAEIASALEFFDLIQPCVCNPNEYCNICGGSRYILNEALTPDEMRSISLVTGVNNQVEIAKKLQIGLIKALQEVGQVSYEQGET